MKLGFLFIEKHYINTYVRKYFKYFKCKIEELCLQHISTSFLQQIEACLLGVNHLTSFAEPSL